MMTTKHNLVIGTPPRNWKEGLPCGNGKLGAVLYGNVHQDTILVNDERFYFRSRTPELPDISSRLKELRGMMLEKAYTRANHLYEEALLASGYNPQIAVVQPGFDVLLKTRLDKPFTKYWRELDMAQAEARVHWSVGNVDYKKRMFVSHSRNLIAFRMSASQPGSVNLEIGMDLHDDADAVCENGHRMEVPLGADVDVSGSTITLTGYHTDGQEGRFGGVLRAVHQGGECRVVNRCLHISGADSVDLQVMTFAGEKDDGRAESARRKLEGLDEGYETYFQENITVHKTYYDTLDLDLGGSHAHLTNEALLEQAYSGELPVEMVEKLFYFGRYLMVCSSVPGSLPAHLQGKWNGDYDPPWQCFYMANENIQMNYWQCLRGNLLPNILPLFDYYESLIDDFRITARHLFGCRGILIPAATAPDSGLPKLLRSHILYWTGAAGWIAQHFYDYYLYTGDITFLRERALPFMREVAQFYEDFLVEGLDGRYLLMPAISPENYPSAHFREWEDGGPVFVSINATMEIAICRELFSNLIEGSRAAGLHETLIPGWNSLLEQLPEYQTSESGGISEWVHPDFPDHDNHRHLSHLYPFFPGREFSPADPVNRDTIPRILEQRLAQELSHQTGWSLVHIANIYSRLGRGDEALSSLHLLARSCIGSNFLSYHNDDRRMGITMHQIWGRTAPFQIDANMGFPAVILEMLIASRAGEITLLPGLPERWRRGRVTGLRAIGDIQVALEWNLKLGRLICRLLASRPQRISIRSSLRLCQIESTQGFEQSGWGFEGGVLELELPASQSLEIRFRVERDSGEPVEDAPGQVVRLGKPR